MRTQIQHVVSIFTSLVFFTGISILIFTEIHGRKVATQREIQKFDKEKPLKFSGIVSDYRTDIQTEISVFKINDSVLIRIPRSSKEVNLSNGDAINKEAGENTYSVRYFYGINGSGKDTTIEIKFFRPE